MIVNAALDWEGVTECTHDGNGAMPISCGPET